MADFGYDPYMTQRTTANPPYMNQQQYVPQQQRYNQQPYIAQQQYYPQQNQYGDINKNEPRIPQIQYGGFAFVSNIDVAKKWAVAPGCSMTFKDENAPYMYSKTMGMSQLGEPTFEIYKLVKQDDQAEIEPEPHLESSPSDVKKDLKYATKEDMEILYSAFDDLKASIDDIKKVVSNNKRNNKKVDVNNE